jgi:hypothetical protein
MRYHRILRNDLCSIVCMLRQPRISALHSFETCFTGNVGLETRTIYSESTGFRELADFLQVCMNLHIVVEGATKGRDRRRKNRV